MSLFETNRKAASLAATCVCFSLTLVAGNGASLMLDFGPTAVLPAENTLSMGHFANAIPGTQTNWNQITAL